jgi:hypothetical protein
VQQWLAGMDVCSDGVTHLMAILRGTWQSLWKQMCELHSGFHSRSMPCRETGVMGQDEHVCTHGNSYSTGYYSRKLRTYTV